MYKYKKNSAQLSCLCSFVISSYFVIASKSSTGFLGLSSDGRCSDDKKRWAANQLLYNWTLGILLKEGKAYKGDGYKKLNEQRKTVGTDYSKIPLTHFCEKLERSLKWQFENILLFTWNSFLVIHNQNSCHFSQPHV